MGEVWDVVSGTALRSAAEDRLGSGKSPVERGRKRLRHCPPSGGGSELRTDGEGLERRRRRDRAQVKKTRWICHRLTIPVAKQLLAIDRRLARPAGRFTAVTREFATARHGSVAA